GLVGFFRSWPVKNWPKTRGNLAGQAKKRAKAQRTKRNVRQSDELKQSGWGQRPKSRARSHKPCQPVGGWYGARFGAPSSSLRLAPCIRRPYLPRNPTQSL